jgi:transcriptional regulator with XRE-family HTH domain
MTSMSKTPEMPEVAPPRGVVEHHTADTLAALVKKLRADAGLTLEEVAARTAGADPDSPGQPALIKQQIAQYERERKDWLKPAAIRGLSLAFGLPHHVFYGANAVSLGLDPIPDVTKSLIPDAFSRLPADDQMLVRSIIVALSRRAAR